MKRQLPKLISLLLLLDGSLANLHVSQWPHRLGVPSGSNVTLHCELRGLPDPWGQVYPYWVVGGSEEEQRVVYPPPKESRQQAALPETEIGPGLTLRLWNLRPSDSNTYRCLVSIHLPDHQLVLRGNGTVLLVRGPPKEPLPFYFLILLKAVALLCLATAHRLGKGPGEPAPPAAPGCCAASRGP